jgi:hypothetical protein
VSCDNHVEKALAEAAYSALFDTDQNLPRNLEELLNKLATIHLKIAGFIRRKFIYDEAVSVPIATFDLEALKRAIKLVKKLIPVFTNATFMALLDEYENLFPYQQRIVNSYVKLASPDASVKIAKKIGTADTSGTMTGQVPGGFVLGMQEREGFGFVLGAETVLLAGRSCPRCKNARSAEQDESLFHS